MKHFLWSLAASLVSVAASAQTQCWRYDYDSWSCDANAACAFDHRTGRCHDRWSPGPGPGPQPGLQTINMSCRSYGQGWQSCRAPGRVASAALVRIESQQPCWYGQTWGWDYDTIWVADGCRAQFRVSYYPYR